MRITDTMLNQTYLRNVYRSKTNLERLSNLVATGSKVNKPSDSPAAAAKILRTNNSIGDSESYLKNIQEALFGLNETTTAMEAMLQDVTEIRNMFAELENPALSSNTEIYAEKFRMALGTMLDMANQEYNGKYLFGGTNFSTKPFGYTADGSAVEQKAADVSGELNVKIGRNLTQKINMTGEEIFGTIGTDDIFNTIKRIADDLSGGGLPSDQDKQIVEDFYDSFLNSISKTGTVVKKLKDSEELLNNHILSLEEMLSKESDVDIIKTMIELEQQDYLLQLAYKTSAMVLPKSLVDYL